MIGTAPAPSLTLNSSYPSHEQLLMAFLQKGRRSAGPTAGLPRLGGRVGGSFVGNRAFGPDIAQIPGNYTPPGGGTGAFLPLFFGSSS